MCRRVLRHVVLPTIGCDLAPPALDLCSLLALGEITEPSQLAAKSPVSGQVLCRVVLAAVESDSTPRTLVEGLVLRIHLALGELADPHVCAAFASLLISAIDSWVMSMMTQESGVRRVARMWI